jgi:hypothetical protein
MGNRNLAVPLFGLLTFGALLISAAGKPQADAWHMLALAYFIFLYRMFRGEVEAAGDGY